MKAPNSFTIRPDHGGKVAKRELVSWRIARDGGEMVYLILYKAKKQFSITIPKKEAEGIAERLREVLETGE